MKEKINYKKLLKDVLFRCELPNGGEVYKMNEKNLSVIFQPKK